MFVMNQVYKYNLNLIYKIGETVSFFVFQRFFDNEFERLDNKPAYNSSDFNTYDQVADKLICMYIYYRNIQSLYLYCLNCLKHNIVSNVHNHPVTL